MSRKAIVMLGMGVGSTIGGWLPVLFGVSAFSAIALITTAIGGLAGVWLAFKLTS